MAVIKYKHPIVEKKIEDEAIIINIVSSTTLYCNIHFLKIPYKNFVIIPNPIIPVVINKYCIEFTYSGILSVMSR